MGEKSDEILDHIEAQREELGANLNELESKVRHTTDWRTHFDNNPYLLVGLAVGGGLLVGGMASGRSHGRTVPSSNYAPSGTYASSSSRMGIATSLQRDRASEALDNIKGALIAFALTKAKELLNDVLPGFENHLKDTEEKRSSAMGSSGRTAGNTFGQEQTTSSNQGSNFGQDYASGFGSRPEMATPSSRATSEAGSQS